MNIKDVELRVFRSISLVFHVPGIHLLHLKIISQSTCRVDEKKVYHLIAHCNKNDLEWQNKHGWSDPI